MERVLIYNKEYAMNRKKGSSLSDKFNRALSLMLKFASIEKSLDTMIGRYNSKNAEVRQTARLALGVKLMMHLGIRVGNEGSAEGYCIKVNEHQKDKSQDGMFVQTYGLSTLLKEHLVIGKDSVDFMFLGKKHKDNYFSAKGELAEQVKNIYNTYDGETFLGVTNYELTKFIKTKIGKNYSPKDFRCMRANMYAWEFVSDLLGTDKPKTKTDYNKEVKGICEKVSEKLNNTASVCKTSYIDSMLWEYLINERFEGKKATKIKNNTKKVSKSFAD